MTDTTTLADDLIAAGKQPHPGGYRCTVVNPVSGRTCRYVGPAFSFANVADFDAVDRAYICGNCYQDLVRLAEQMGRIFAALAGPPAWDSEEGAYVRAQRNAKLAAAFWTVQVGSPLTEACQAEWADYIRALHRLTVDYPGPADVVWPAEPELIYA